MTSAVPRQNSPSQQNCPHDQRWMRAAIAAGRRAEGRSGNNPPVGCVLLGKDGQLLAIGQTGAGGVPHAEAMALDAVISRYGSLAPLLGGTAYVTLEPCAHHGKTPPCSQALIKAGIGRLVVAAQDPDPRVNGAGIAEIKSAGITVTTGILTAEAKNTLNGFFTRIQSNRPFCSLKIASSIDGRIALSDRQQLWITGAEMRRYVHALRSRADALATGIGTVLADDPQLTCRNSGLIDDSPPVFVFDSQLQIPVTAALCSTPPPLSIFHSITASPERQEALIAQGVTLIALPSMPGRDIARPDIKAAMSSLADQGVNHLFVEAGTGLATAFLSTGFVDRIYWTQSNHILGDQAVAAVGALTDTPINPVALSPETQYIQTGYQAIGMDRLVILEKLSR